MDRGRQMEESDDSDIDLLELQDQGRQWKTSPLPQRALEEKNSKRSVNASRTNSSAQDMPSRQKNKGQPPSRAQTKRPAKKENTQEVSEDEESEEERNQTEDQEEEIPYLFEVAEDHREAVKLILSLEASSDKKLEKLETLVTVKIHKKYMAWLHEQDNTTDFVKFLPGRCQKMASAWEKEKDVEILDGLIKREGNENATEAYKRWKTKHGLDVDTQKIIGDAKIQEESSQEKPETLKNDKPRKKVRIAEDKKSTNKRDGKKENKQEMDDQESQAKNRGRQKNDKAEPSHAGRKNKDESNKNSKREGRRKPENEVDSDGEDYHSAEEAKEDSGIFPDEMPHETNVVLLGSSGVGKSTFINSVANWFSHRSLGEARENPVALINAEFNHVDEHAVCHPVKYDANYSTQSLGNSTELFSTGQSVTQKACHYTFKVGISGRIIRIIDTPGVNDTRGTDQDTRNFTEIVNYLGHFKRIHAFVFMLQPNESRLTLHFRYAMNELLTHLHSSAADNIIFCFTNGKATNYRAGETHDVLQDYLSDLREKRNIKIELQGRIFVFDSEIFRYICSYNNGINFTVTELKQIEASWAHGKEELAKMLRRVSTLKPHDIINTLSVTKVRRAIEGLAGPLAEITKTHTENMQMLTAQQLQIEECIANGKDLTSQLYIKEIHMETQQLEHPMTVCGHMDCVTWEKLHPYAAMEKVYSRECHDKCYLSNVKIGDIANENLLDCEIFGDILNPRICTRCKHGYEHHQHLNYRLVRHLIEIPNKEISEALAKNKDQLSAAENFIATLEELRVKHQQDLEQKQNTCAHFAVFLRKHGIVHYNDQYMGHLNQQIREIEERDDPSDNTELLARLSMQKAQYEALVDIFEKNAKTDGAKTVEQIEEMLTELQTTKDGQLLADIQEIHQSAAEAAVLPPAPSLQIEDRTRWNKFVHTIKKKAQKHLNLPSNNGQPNPPKQGKRKGKKK